MADHHPPEKAKALNPDSLAAEGLGLSELQTIGQRLKRYGTGKGRSYEMAGHLLRAEHEAKLARRLYDCGSLLTFRHWLAHGRSTLSAGRFCQVHLLCPLCAIRRAAKLLRRYVEKAEAIAAHHELFLVTLTVRNGDDLAERHRHLKGSLRKLRERAAKGYGAFAPSPGAFWSFEVTKGATGWHPHVHMVWAMPKGRTVQYGEGSQLRQDWHAITGDSFIVHAARIEPGAEVNGLIEVLKYALKFGELSLADNVTAWRTLKGRHLVQASGIWRGVEEPDDLADDPLDGPYIDLLFRWAGKRGYVPHDQQTHEAIEAPDSTVVESPRVPTGASHGSLEVFVGQGQPHA